MLVQMQFGLQYADFYLGHGILYAISPSPPSSYSYIAILCADSAGTFHSWRESIFSNNWNIYLLYKLWNILEYYRIN